MSKKKSTVELDVLAHSLLPEMKVLETGEKNKVMKKFGINDDQLPRMLITDPAVVALKANIGDLILIKRKDLPGNYDSYRIVIKE